jgi:hypothetical protein
MARKQRTAKSEGREDAESMLIRSDTQARACIPADFDFHAIGDSKNATTPILLRQALEGVM